MNIAFFAYPHSIHDAKWINRLSEKHKIIVFCQKFDQKRNLLFPSVKVYDVLPSTYSFFSLLKNIKIISQLRKIIERNQVEIIHTLYAFPYVFWSGKISQPHIITTRGSDILIEYQKLDFPKGIKQKMSFFILKSLYERHFNNAYAITSTSIAQQKLISTFILKLSSCNFNFSHKDNIL